MSDKEISLLNICLRECQNHYFEWGCGGTTARASLYTNICDITSVDSSQQWINKVSSNPIVKNKQVNYIYIDINADDNNWGKPKNKSKISEWPKYSQAVNLNNQKYDLILIDGRFRVACALQALNHLTDSGVVLIHDYINRPHYHCIEEFYNRVAGVDSLAVLKKKPSYDQTRVASLLKKYELVYD